jgi:hypothetical protein
MIQIYIIIFLLLLFYSIFYYFMRPYVEVNIKLETVAFNSILNAYPLTNIK